MQIVSKEVIGRPDDLTKAVYITCLAQDQSYVESEILPPLDEYGIAYLLTVKTAAACEEYSYYENTEIKISRCSCGIFVFSPAYQEAEDICRQCYFYEIGLFEGTKLDIYPFLISPKSPQMQNFLLDKPISLIQASYDISKIIEEIRKYDNMQEPFFKNNPALNKVVSKRVMYVKFVVLLNISVSTLKNIWNSEEWDKSSFKSAEFDSKEMIDLLFSEINTGITLLSFGSEKYMITSPLPPILTRPKKYFTITPRSLIRQASPKRWKTTFLTKRISPRQLKWNFTYL